MFGTKKPSPQAHSMSSVWAGMTALMAELEGQTRRLEAEVSDMGDALQLKLDSMVLLASQLSKERARVVEDYGKRRAAGGFSPAEDDAFWSRLADMDALIDKTNGQVDDARLRIYFPAARGYLWRTAAPGLYVSSLAAALGMQSDASSLSSRLHARTFGSSASQSNP